MKFIINDETVLLRALEGPIAPHVAPFLKWAIEQGYSSTAVRARLRLAVGFNRWLTEKCVGVSGVSSRHLNKYLRDCSLQKQSWRGDPTALKQFLEFLRVRAAVPVENVRRPRPTPLERHVHAYERYLREERRLVTSSIVSYLPFIRQFLRYCFGSAAIRLSRLSAREVVGFVRRQAPRQHLNTAKLLTAALRSFLKYARYRGYIRLDLTGAVPTVANWSMTSIPRGIAPDQIRRLLAQIDRSTAVGRRDYAILLMLARLGLRACEVAFLELGDIDWNDGSLSVRSKGGRSVKFPLPRDVGAAIAAYIQRGRPRGTCRRVFLCAHAPIRGFRSACTIATIVRHAILRTGVDAPTTGAHQFRHALATKMLRHGASLSEIGELLGHRSPETTKIYATVDIDALRTLALPWPGGAR
jgi:integrase/recombinase XerD